MEPLVKIIIIKVAHKKRRVAEHSVMSPGHQLPHDDVWVVTALQAAHTHTHTQGIPQGHTDSHQPVPHTLRTPMLDRRECFHIRRCTKIYVCVCVFSVLSPGRPHNDTHTQTKTTAERYT